MSGQIYQELKIVNPFFLSYVFIDTTDYKMSNRLEEKIKIKDLRSYRKDGKNISLNIIKIKKADKEIFINFMEEAYNNLLLLGHDKDELDIEKILTVK